MQCMLRSSRRLLATGLSLVRRDQTGDRAQGAGLQGDPSAHAAQRCLGSPMSAGHGQPLRRPPCLSCDGLSFRLCALLECDGCPGTCPGTRRRILRGDTSSGGESGPHALRSDSCCVPPAGQQIRAIGHTRAAPGRRTASRGCFDFSVRKEEGGRGGGGGAAGPAPFDQGNNRTRDWLAPFPRK